MSSTFAGLDPLWFAEEADEFAHDLQRSSIMPTVGAGLIVVGDDDKVLWDAESVRLVDAYKIADQTWPGYPSQVPHAVWTDRVSGLLLGEIAAQPLPDGFRELGRFTSKTLFPGGGNPVSGGWVQPGDSGEVYSWLNSGAAVTIEHSSGLVLVQEHSEVLREMFPGAHLL